MVGTCSNGGNNKVAPFSMKAYFNEVLPIYILYGMTPEQYWKEDTSYAVAYKEAYEIREKKKNEEMWWQGLYTYAALCKAAPLFAMKPSQPAPYLDMPIPRSEEEKAENEAKKQAAVMKEYMLSFTQQHNREEEARE